jgi:D-sedoheptulose 7-phosphate isomerase
MNSHLDTYFSEVTNSSKNLDLKKINSIIEKLIKIKKKQGRVFCVGIGGSAANCSHLVNDLRKLCLIDAISPLDNVSEFSARINDDGWNSSIVESLKVSKINQNDTLFVLSVGGGSMKKKVSMNIVNTLKYCIKNNITIMGIVGKTDGYAFKSSNLVVNIPIDNEKLITPISESFQTIIWHAIVSDKRIQDNKTKW